MKKLSGNGNGRELWNILEVLGGGCTRWVFFGFWGKCSYVYLFDIMYMTESWLERPVSAIKARLELNDFYVNSLYRYDFKWSQNGE